VAWSEGGAIRSVYSFEYGRVTISATVLGRLVGRLVRFAVFERILKMGAAGNLVSSLMAALRLAGNRFTATASASREERSAARSSRNDSGSVSDVISNMSMLIDCA
jgi:hypothetical protein